MNSDQQPYDNEKWLTMANDFYAKEFSQCNLCNFKCNKNSDWQRHLSTQKHKKLVKISAANDKKFECECGNEYKHMSSLCKHKKRCTFNNQTEKVDTDNAVSSDLILEFMKQNKDMQSFLIDQNKELQNTIIEISKNQTVTNIQNNNIQNINNFNLNVFLNEQCKDAISITDFVESLQLEISDLEETGKLGYVLGISRIIIDRLKKLDVYERPLHCTDIKRETLYIKDKDVWEKESSEKSHLKQFVKNIAKKNLQKLPAWQEKNPDFIKTDTPENNEFLKISLNSLGAYNEEEEEKDMNKIMRNVLKEVVLDKNKLIN
jgi:hypothetical protein